MQSVISTPKTVRLTQFCASKLIANQLAGEPLAQTLHRLLGGEIKRKKQRERKVQEFRFNLKRMQVGESCWFKWHKKRGQRSHPAFWAVSKENKKLGRIAYVADQTAAGVRVLRKS